MAVQRFLVTGANKGIGLAIVEKLLQDLPESFVFLGSRNADRGAAAVDAIVQKNPASKDRVSFVQLDVTDDASVKNASAAIAAKFPEETPLNGLINNAGTFLRDDLRTVLEINVFGVKRCIDTFLPLLQPKGGRIVNISSASGPNFVAECTGEQQAIFTNQNATSEDVATIAAKALATDGGDASFQELGWQTGSSKHYGLSKALVNMLTMETARLHPALVVNAVTPGFIETDLTQPFAVQSGKTPSEMGMKSTQFGAVAPVKLAVAPADTIGRGWYYGSDGERSPLDRYRSPGDPPYTE
eukprot:m.898199 g.898199  ORF g.898199 m.898199 type:complete len:299 (+) comp23671_c2_seq6:53-949(+)